MAMGSFNKKKLEELFTNSFHNNIPEDPYWFYRQHFRTDLSPLKAFQYLDIKTFMAELVLQKVDRASMANSLEARVPFLDLELVEYMFNLEENVYFSKKLFFVKF
jgi:asparagine synthase (glutamine-hydrolysing)